MTESARNEPFAEPMEHSLAWDDPEQRRSEGLVPTPWAQAVSDLGPTSTYWLATVRPDGRPHLVPVLAVMVDGVLHFSAGDRSRKARNIAADPRCVITTSGASVDLVVEGSAAAVTNCGEVRQVAEAYAASYGWQPEERDGLLWGDGAPTAGPPPYRVYRVSPDTAFGFPTDDWAVPTRWRFA